MNGNSFNLERIQRVDQITPESIPKSRTSQSTGEGSGRQYEESELHDTGVPFTTQRYLTTLDVAALIINKMVGTGIFTGPPSVLLYVGDRRTAIGLWVVGFIWTVLWKLPYTGGELIYLDAVIPSKPLLSYTVYSFYYILIYTTTTNALQFGRQAILAATLSHDDLDQRVWRLIAVMILSVVCLLVYFSPRWSRNFNKLFAGLKIAVLLVIFCAGARQASNHNIFYEPRNSVQETQGNNHLALPSATAVLTALFSFQGWENATLVSGEIKNHATLRKGFLIGVLVVGLLYILIAIVYSYGVPWNNDGSLDPEFAPQLFGSTESISESAQQAWAIITALSAVGSMLSVTYTCSRVKQVIAWGNIIPWSPFWRRTTSGERITADSMAANDSDDEIENNMISTPPESPEGGIILHWVISMAYIGISAAILDISEAASFSGRLLSYGSVCVNVILAFMYPRVAAIPPDQYEIVALRWNPGKEILPLRWHLGRWTLSLLIGLSGLAILVFAAFPGVSDKQTTGWTYLVINVAVAAGGLLYWLCFLNCSKGKATLMRLGNASPHLTKHGTSDADPLRQCFLCRSQQYRGQAHRHLTYGCEQYLSIEHKRGFWFADLLYWLFGGQDQTGNPRSLARNIRQWWFEKQASR